MTTTPTPRRVRIAQCLYCGHLFRWQRKRPGDELALQVCPHCFMAHEGSRIPTTLERHEDCQHIR